MPSPPLSQRLAYSCVSLLLLRLHHPLRILLTSLEPPSPDQDRETSHNDARVVHVIHLDGLDVGEREEHNGEREPAAGDRVHDRADPGPHVEDALVHIPPAREEVGEDGEHVRDVIDGDGRPEEGVEGGGGAEVQASQGRDDGGDGHLRVEGDLECGVNLGPAVMGLDNASVIPGFG